MNNTLKIAGLYIDNDCLGDLLLVSGVSPYYAYANNERTDTVEGYRYTLTLPAKQFSSIGVKIEGQQRIDLGTSPYKAVRFDNLRIKLYYDKEHKLQLSARADDVIEISGAL